MWGKIKGFLGFLNEQDKYDLGNYPLPNLTEVSAQGRKDSFSNNEEIEHPLILANYELKLTHYWNETYLKTQRYLNQLEDQRNSLEFSVEPKNIKSNLEGSSHGYINFKPSEFEHAYENAHNEYVKAHKNFEDFRQDHHLRRLPSHFNTFYKTLAILVILFAAETYINSELFKVITVGDGADKEGIQEAIFLSLTQTGINMVTCFLCGRYIFGRVMFLDKTRKKASDTIIFISHILFIIYLNLCVGMYRALIATGTDKQNILNSALWPFPHLSDFDVPSALVAGIGIVLALGAYLDGYFSDDRYPGYGDVARLLRATKDYAAATYKKYHDLWNSLVKEFGDEKSKIYNKTISNIEKLSYVLNRIQKIKVDYEQLVENMNKAYTQAVKSYNQGFNSSSSKKTNVKEKEIFDGKQSDAIATFKDVLNEENLMTDNQRIKYIKILQDKFTTEFKEEIDHLVKLNKEKSDRLEQIRSKFKFQ
jgi:hypothetical protein